MSDDEPGSSLIADASVLIDYRDSDISILALAAERRRIHITASVLDEVNDLDERTCDELGLTAVELTTQQALRAGKGSRRLSFEDRTCLVVAKDEDLVVVTNDRRLRAECEEQGVGVLWGLEIMVHLVSVGDLPSNDAIEVAEAIQAANPRFVTEQILDEFRARLRSDGG